jgi:predicted adenylyl cyclase CyaB
MPSNIEIKIKIPSFKKYENVLKSRGLKQEELLNQKDIYYETKKGLLKLRIENGRNSLIKYLRDEKSKTRVSNYDVLMISDNSGERFFGDIFKKKAVVEKKRILYLYKNTRIHLDKIRTLGNFIELESVIVKDKKSAIEEFNKVIKLLELERKNQIRKSNLDLILEK